MSREDIEILRERALSFMRNADRLIEEGEWDLAIFCIEQYCQLIFKYILLLIRGSYPRTHSLRRLIREVGDYDDRILKLIEDTDKLHYIARLEEAYIASRYLPYRYEENEVKDIYKFVIEVFRPIVEEIRV